MKITQRPSFEQKYFKFKFTAFRPTNIDLPMPNFDKPKKNLIWGYLDGLFQYRKGGGRDDFGFSAYASFFSGLCCVNTCTRSRKVSIMAAFQGPTDGSGYPSKMKLREVEMIIIKKFIKMINSSLNTLPWELCT